MISFLEMRSNIFFTFTFSLITTITINIETPNETKQEPDKSPNPVTHII